MREHRKRLLKTRAAQGSERRMKSKQKWVISNDRQEMAEIAPSRSDKKGKGKYRQVPEIEEERKTKGKRPGNEEEDEEAQPRNKKKKKKQLNLNALPEQPVELKCPMCGHEGETVLKKSFADRGKIGLFYLAVTALIVMFFIFILIFLIIQ